MMFTPRQKMRTRTMCCTTRLVAMGPEAARVTLGFDGESEPPMDGGGVQQSMVEA